MVFAFLTPESEMILKVLRTKGSKTGVRGVKNTNLSPIKNLDWWGQKQGVKYPLYRERVFDHTP